MALSHLNFIDDHLGTVKFAVQITSWSFCGDTGVMCTNEGMDEVGSYLDFEIVVTGTSEPTKKNEGMQYDLGSGVIAFMTQVSEILDYILFFF